MRMRFSGSSAFTSIVVPTLYISQSHRTCLPTSNLPLPRLNQKRDVMAGLTNASNTTEMGLRISICAVAIG